MNIFSLKELFNGIFDRNPLAEAFRHFQPMPSGPGYYHRFTGKSKTFKKNKRRGL